MWVGLSSVMVVSVTSRSFRAILGVMPRVLLLLPTETYRAKDFLAAAERLGVEVVVGCERRQALADAMGDRAVVVPLGNVDVAVEIIAALHDRRSLDAVLAVDDQGLVVAAAASARLGLTHNPIDAVAATRDKAALRARLAAGAVAQPDYRVVAPGQSVAAAAAQIGYPCVVKPVSRSGSQGVIRVDDDVQASAVAERVRAIVGPDEPVLVEGFVAGAEVAVEALLVGGVLEVLAVFDKPDPLDGPFFEETIYVTPSRQPAPILASLAATVAAAAAAVGLREGPGPCRTARRRRWSTRGHRGGGPFHRRSVRPVVAFRGRGQPRRDHRAPRHRRRARRAAPRDPGVGGDDAAHPGRRDAPQVSGQAEALAVEGVVGLEITIPAGRAVVPLPEGDRYLGFVFARGPTPADVELALRRAEAALDVVVSPGS